LESETDEPLSSSPASNSTDSSESSGDDEPAENFDVKSYIYAGAKLTYSESLLLLLRYSLVHALTKRALEDLLQLMALFLPTVETTLPSSVYVLKRAFVEAFPSVPVRKVLYCSNCQALLDRGSSCGKSSCSGHVKDFVFISLYQQLKLKLEDKLIWKALQETYRKRVLCQSSDDVLDIYCGKEYRQHSFLMRPGNISLTLNTDGVAIFKSSKNSLWPVWLVINELPPKERFSRKNMILAALWFSEQKPTISTLLGRLIEELNDLYINGLTVITEHGERVVRAALLICSVDLPARSMCANMKQFNGKYGCIYCENPGTPRVRTPTVRDWPRRPGALRTHDSILHNAQQAISTGEAITLCDQRLKSIRPPDVISRQIRSISEYAHWKGSEFKSWLLYYSMPVLRGILPPVYLAHYSITAHAVFPLCVHFRHGCI
jgi:hypothetical protein